MLASVLDTVCETPAERLAKLVITPEILQPNQKSVSIRTALEFFASSQEQGGLQQILHANACSDRVIHL